MLFFGKKNPFDSEEDNTVSLKGLPPVRVPVDDGNGGLKLGFRTERSRSAAIKECKDGVSSRCASGAAGGCALSAARACAVEFPTKKRKGGKGPLKAIRDIVFPGGKRSEEPESEEEKRQRELREECERRHRDECLDFATKACGQHAESFCAVAVDSTPGEQFFRRRGESDRGRMKDIADEIFDASPGRGKR